MRSGETVAFSVSTAGVTCNVDATFVDGRVDPRWRRMAEPYFTSAGPSADAGAHLVLRVDRGGERARLLGSVADWHDLVLHGEMPGRRGAGAGREVFASSANGAVYTVTPGAVPRLDILYADDGEQSVIDAFRVLRGWLTMAREHRGESRCHLAAASVGGVGIALVGGKGAGKTSFMLNLLRSGDVAFVTNDKAVALTDDGGDPVVAGLPYAVAIGCDSLPSLPEVAPSEGFVVREKLYVWPSRLTELMGAGIQASTAVSFVFECRLDLAADAVAVEPLAGPEIDALLPSVGDFGGGDRINPDWLGQALGLTRRRSAPESLRKARWYRLSGNPWSGDWRRQLAGQVPL